MPTPADPFDALLEFAAILERLGIDYAVVGSLASILYGEVRTTQDADLVVLIAADRVDALTQALQKAFYADSDSIRERIHDGRSFNVLHLETMFKLDLFPIAAGSLDAQQLQRRRRIRIKPDSDRQIWVISPEDLLLQKLRWFRRGGEVSDQQWRDILGVMRVQGDRLDWRLLETEAAVLQVGDLLTRARSQTPL